ncbi:MAG TPA: hypothetical protein V6D16_08815 [Candidatus Obscuribacterales bacterium]
MKELSYHQLLEDALDLPERADVDELEYEIDGEEPQFQMMQVPGEAPIEMFNFSGAKNFPWKSYLLNSYLVTGVIFLVVTVIIIVVAGLQSGQQQSTINPNPAATEIQATAEQLTQTRYSFNEATTRTDLNPTYVANPGLLQKAILAGAAEFNRKVDEQRADIHSPWYQAHRNEVIQSAIVNALKQVNSAAAGQASTLISEDPATGKKVVQKLTIGQTQALGITQLLIIEAAQQPTLQNPNLTENALAIMGWSKRLKDNTADLLEAQGMGPVAEKLRNKDLFGRELIPQEESPPDKPSSPTTQPTTKKPAPKPSFNHVEPQGLTMP